MNATMTYVLSEFYKSVIKMSGGTADICARMGHKALADELRADATKYTEKLEDLNKPDEK